MEQWILYKVNTCNYQSSANFVQFYFSCKQPVVIAMLKLHRCAAMCVIFF